MICSADWHLRRTRPRSRKDDYWQAQERKVRFILELAKQSPPLVIAGDVFDVAKPGEPLLTWIIDLLNEYGVKPVVVPGQHDLPGHSLARVHESGLGVLASAEIIDLLTNPSKPFWAGDDRDMTISEVYGCPYGLEPIPISFKDPMYPNVLLWHHMTINQQPLWPGQVADKGHLLLSKYSQFDLVVTGDNHQSFAIATTVKALPVKHVRWLVNPGSIMRMSSIQIEHKPCVYRYDNGKAEQVFLPIEEDVFDLDKINIEKARDSRMQAFVEMLRRDGAVASGREINFEAELQELVANKGFNKAFVDFLWECVDEAREK